MHLQRATVLWCSPIKSRSWRMAAPQRPFTTFLGICSHISHRSHIHTHARAQMFSLARAARAVCAMALRQAGLICSHSSTHSRSPAPSDACSSPLRSASLSPSLSPSLPLSLQRRRFIAFSLWRGIQMATLCFALLVCGAVAFIAHDS